MKQHSLNRIWAKLILISLYRAGVRHIAIAPGSRSTPLTLEAQALSLQFSDLKLHTHFDERGLGFLALGLAKGEENQSPVALIVTSGTAVANLFPALIEANLTRQNLIVLSGDRPPELIGCGANQAIDQHNIFGSHVTQFMNLPVPSESISAQWLVCEMAKLLARQSQVKGAIHLNCPFPEPLYGELENDCDYLAPVQTWLLSKQPYLQQYSPQYDSSSYLNIEKLLIYRRGIIICGQVSQKERHSIEQLAKACGWPLFVDPQAGLSNELAGYDIWLNQAAAQERLAEVECVIQFGGRLVSKRLNQFLSQYHHDYYLIADDPSRLDWHHQATFQIQAVCDWAALQLQNQFLAAPYEVNQDWYESFATLSQAYWHHLTDYLEPQTIGSEMSLVHDIAKVILPNTDLWIGNSMPIRLMDMVACLPNIATFTNRGASGIDGLIATAIGVQRARARPMICLLGDTSALYDLNSFALLKKQQMNQIQQPFVLVIINNDGGGIFDLLPVPAESREKFYQMPHGIDFKAAASMFGLNYLQTHSRAEIVLNIKNAQLQNEVTLIEVIVPVGQASQDIRQLIAAIESI